MEEPPVAREPTVVEVWAGDPVRVPAWPALGMALAVPPITWLATRWLDTELPDHMVGPFQIPLLLEWLVGSVAVACGLLGLWSVIRRAAGPPPGWSVSVGALGVVAVAEVAATVGWRLMTVGVGGVSIGGAAIALLGPWLLAGMLVVAVGLELSSRGFATERTVWGTGVALAALMFLLVVTLL